MALGGFLLSILLESLDSAIWHLLNSSLCLSDAKAEEYSAASVNRSGLDKVSGICRRW